MECSSTIRTVTLERRSLPLCSPYVLSFATLEAFDTLLVRFTLDDGSLLLGETVPLPGYMEETPESVEATAVGWLDVMPGRTIQEARDFIAEALPVTPCACSLFLSALDVPRLLYTANLKPFEPTVPIVFPCSSGDSALAEKVRSAHALGFKTLKLKVGSYLDVDIEAVRQLSLAMPADMIARLDANQGYSFAQARQLVIALEQHLGPRCELLEQPFPPDAWEHTRELARATTVPIMLDESITCAVDIPKASECNAKYVKLKLCKQGGVKELLQAARQANDLGLRVILGNGVATNIANHVELSVYAMHRELFSGASESNGFAKMRRQCEGVQLRIESGQAAW